MRPRTEMNAVVGSILRYGVLVSSLLIVAGLALMIARPPPGLPPSVEQVPASGFGSPALSAGALVGGVADGDPMSVLELGLVVLVATPIARVCASVVLFGLERDLLYAGITALVLGMLLVAIVVIGPAVA